MITDFSVRLNLIDLDTPVSYTHLDVYKRQVYCNPASHGEGRFVANEEWLQKLFANGQVATQYVTPDGQLSVDEEWNVNGSYMNIEGCLLYTS